MFEQSTPKRYCGIRYILPPSSSRRITSVQGLDDAKAIPGVLEVEAEFKVGDRTQVLSGSLSRLASVRAARTTRAELMSTLEQAVSSMRFGYEA